MLLLQLLLSATLPITVGSSQLPVDNCQLTVDSNQLCWRLRIESEEWTVDRWQLTASIVINSQFGLVFYHLINNCHIQVDSSQLIVDRWQVTASIVVNFLFLKLLFMLLLFVRDLTFVFRVIIIASHLSFYILHCFVFLITTWQFIVDNWQCTF